MKMKKLLFSTIAISLGVSGLSAQTKIHPKLTDVAAKVDTDGDYLKLSYIRNDYMKAMQYAELLVDSFQLQKPDFPQDLKAREIMKLLGFDNISAVASSSKKQGAAWNNKDYLHTGGENKGILGLLGDNKTQFVGPNFAPADIDLMYQLRLNLSELPDIMKKVAMLTNSEVAFKKNFEKEIPELGGMTISQLISKIDTTSTVIIDVDFQKNRPLPFPVPMELPAVDLLARLDNVGWMWPFLEKALLEESGLKWLKTEKDGVVTLTVPEDMKENLLGYSLAFHLEDNNIWFSSSEALLDKSLSEGKKLAQDASFVKSLETLPKEGNFLFYMSNEMQKGVFDLYKKAETAAAESNDDTLKKASPFIHKFFNDLTKSNEPLTMVIDFDEQGILSITRLPFPTKNYFNMNGQAIFSLLQEL